MAWSEKEKTLFTELVSPNGMSENCSYHHLELRCSTVPSTALVERLYEDTDWSSAPVSFDPLGQCADVEVAADHPVNKDARHLKNASVL